MVESLLFPFLFFFSCRRRHTRSYGDWSSDVCSSDLVLENVLVGHYYGRPQGVTGVAQDRAMEILDFIGLGDRAHRLPGELTLADRKRLEVARALATGPKVLLLDEVVAGLNLVESRRVVQLIRQIRDRGLSIIVIEHVMHALMRLSDCVMVLDHGHKIAEGKPEEF